MYLHITNDKNRWSKGLWEVWEEKYAKSTKQTTKQEDSFSIPRKTTMLITHFPCEGGNPSRAPKHLSENLTWLTDRERGDGEEGKADWWVVCPPPSTLSPSMYLRAAKPCLILMSSAFCNLTWEFKSCLSFASLMSAGSYTSRKAKKKEEIGLLSFGS